MFHQWKCRKSPFLTALYSSLLWWIFFFLFLFFFLFNKSVQESNNIAWQITLLFLPTSALSQLTLSSTSNWTGKSNLVYVYFGSSVSSVEDIFNNGYNDVIVDVYYYSNGQTNKETVFIYLESASRLFFTPNWIVEGNQLGFPFSYHVFSAKDVNNNEYDDD